MGQGRPALCRAVLDRPGRGVSSDRGTPPRVTTYLERFAAALPGEGTVATAAVLAVLLAALALLATALLVRVDRRRPWAAAGWAMSPVLLVHWLSWELVAAVGVAVLLWGWVTGRTWLAGVGAGIGAAFALPVAAALAGVLAVGGRTRDRVDALLAAAAAYVVVTLPGRARTEDPDVGSIWQLFPQTGSAMPSRSHPDRRGARGAGRGRRPRSTGWPSGPAARTR